MSSITIQDFPLNTHDKVRYSDTDRQGHVNNAVFASFIETGRVEVICNPKHPILADNCSFVIASLKVDFLKEIHWPGTVVIGTGVSKVGNSSMSLEQGLFQNEILVAKAQTVIVQVDDKSGKSTSLTDFAKSQLENWKWTGFES